MNGNKMEKPEKEEVAMVPKAGWGEKPGIYESDVDGADEEEGCGVASCKPSFLQRFSGIGFFTVLFGAVFMYVNALSAYLSTQFVWLERLYDISPGGLRMMVTLGEIAFVVVVLFISHLARRWHMPRTLAITTFVIGLAAILCVLPYAVHKPGLMAPPNVTKETQFTIEKFQMMAPSCVVDEAASQELMPKIMDPSGCEPEGEKQKSPAAAQKTSSPAKDSEKTDDTSAAASPPDEATTSGGDNATAQDPDGGGAADTPGDSDAAAPGDADEGAADPPAPGPTIMVPDFHKISQHEIFPQLVAMAKNAFNTDLEAIAKMSKEDQVKALANMSPEMRQNLPLLKNMLGPDADSYFYPVALPQSRRRRQAEGDGGEGEAAPGGAGGAGNGDSPSGEAAAGDDDVVLLAANETAPVEDKKEEEEGKKAAAVVDDGEKKEEEKKSAKDKMLEQLQKDMNWNGQLVAMFGALFSDPCTIKKVREHIGSLCPYNTGPFLEDTEDAASLLVALIVLGMLLAGMARAAYPAFSAIYVDSRTAENKTGLYLGIVFGLGAFGAVVAQMFAFQASTTYITLEDVGLMSFLNPRWLGAWWTGLLVLGLALLILAPFLFLFPNPSDRMIAKESRVKGISKIVKGFFHSGMRLLGNPIFLLITLGNALTVMAADGMLRHLPKYVESEFSFPPMAQGIYLALALTIIIAVGVFVGGIISSLAKLSPFNCLKLVSVCALVVFVLQACALGLGCEQPKVNKGENMVNLTTGGSVPCIKTCMCMDFLYTPACGSDGVTYFTPCHAGCGHPLDGEWHHCKCIADDQQTTKPGICEQDCWGGMFYGFSFVIALACFLVAMKSVPAFLAMFRSVEKQDAPLAIGVNAFMVTLVGVIPSSNLYSSMFEGICLLERTACGPMDSCAIYDVEALRMRYNGLATGLKAFAALFYVVAMVLGFRESSVYNRKIHVTDRRK